MAKKKCFGDFVKMLNKHLSSKKNNFLAIFDARLCRVNDVIDS